MSEKFDKLSAKLEAFIATYPNCKKDSKHFCEDIDDADNCEEDITNSEIVWTVIQRRDSALNNTNFDRKWNDYKYGFGSYNGEFYIGNKKLHQLSLV